VGAAVLAGLSTLPSLLSYQVAGHAAVITPVKLVVGLAILAFGILEPHPRFAA
jgi:hypothetical protein